EPTEDSVRAVNVGPTKRLNRVLAFLLGVKDGDLSHDEWTTHFSPMHNVYDHWWTSPDGERQGMVRWRLYIFFVPIDAETTAITSFTYAQSRYKSFTGTGGMAFVWPYFRHEVNRELRQ